MRGDVDGIRAPNRRARYLSPLALAMTGDAQSDPSQLKPGIKAYDVDVQPLDAPMWIPAGGTRSVHVFYSNGIPTTVASCTRLRERALS